MFSNQHNQKNNFIHKNKNITFIKNILNKIFQVYYIKKDHIVLELVAGTFDPSPHISSHDLDVVCSTYVTV